MDKNEFHGATFHTIDSKGRLFIPENDRAALGEGFVLSLSSDLKTMAFYRADYWERKSAYLRAIPETDRRAHELLRLIFGSTYVDITPDSQGRVLLPQAVRKNFRLPEGGEAVLMGVGSSLELWNRESYDARYGTVSAANIDELLDYINDKYSDGEDKLI